MRTETNLTETVLALPEKRRFELVEALLGSLAPPGAELTDEELSAELDRRWQEYQADPSIATSWEEVKKNARKNCK